MEFSRKAIENSSHNFIDGLITIILRNFESTIITPPTPWIYFCKNKFQLFFLIIFILNLRVTKIFCFLTTNIGIVFNISQNKILSLDTLFYLTFFFWIIFKFFFVDIELTHEPPDPAIYYIALKSPFILLSNAYLKLIF